MNTRSGKKAKKAVGSNSGEEEGPTAGRNQGQRDLPPEPADQPQLVTGGPSESTVSNTQGDLPEIRNPEFLKALIAEAMEHAVSALDRRMSEIQTRLSVLEMNKGENSLQRPEHIGLHGATQETVKTRESATAARGHGDGSCQQHLPDNDPTARYKVPPHLFITDDPLTSRIERDISEAFHYAFVLAPEVLPDAVPETIIAETLALEQRGEFASIPQSFVFKASQILRELDVHLCSNINNARSRLFHCLTGQKCTCVAPVTNSGIEMKQSDKKPAIWPKSAGDHPHPIQKSRRTPPDPSGGSSDSSGTSDDSTTSSRSRDESEPTSSSSSSSSDSLSARRLRYRSERMTMRHRGARAPSGGSMIRPGEQVSKFCLTIAKLFATSQFSGRMDESIFLHTKRLHGIYKQLQVPPKFWGSLAGASLSGSALSYYYGLWDTHDRVYLPWKRAKAKLQQKFGSRYHVEAADAVLRELSFGRIAKPGEPIIEAVERMTEKIRHLTSIVHRGRERRSDVRRALLFAISREWFASRLPSHMETVEDVQLQISRVVKSQRHGSTGSSNRAPQSSFMRSLEGRYYDKPVLGPSKLPRKSQNPRDTQGRIMLCRGCGSPDHFVAQCPSKREVSQALFEEFEAMDQEHVEHQPSSPGAADGKNEQYGPELSSCIEQIGPVESSNLARCLREKADQCFVSSSVAELNTNCRDPFLGICVDTGTTRSMIGRRQFDALCRMLGYVPKLTPSLRKFRCGNEVHPSLGHFQFRIPVGGSFFQSIEVDLVDVQNPFLLGLNDMQDLAATIDLHDLSWIVNGERNKLELRDQHLWMPLPDIDSCCFTKQELQLLHRRLGHPHTDRIMALLKKAAPSEISAETRTVLNDLIRSCEQCQRTQPRPLVYRVSTPDDIVFGHELLIDLFKLKGKTVLHCVDRGTGLIAAKFVPGETARDIWDTLLEIWITKYVTPNVITTDAGTAFVSKQFQDHVETFGTLIRAVPVESHNSLNRGEQAHGPLRRVFEKISHNSTLTDDVLLSLSVKAINEMSDVRGFIPLELVYGILPKLPIGPNSPYVRQKERLAALRVAREEYGTIIAQKRLQTARELRGPGDHPLEENDLCLIYREDSKRWEGPARVVSVDAGGVVHVLQKGGKVLPFSSSAVRRYNPPEAPTSSHNLPDSAKFTEAYLKETSLEHDCDSVFEAWTRSETIINQGDERFEAAKLAELKQLFDCNTFEWVDASAVPHDANVLRTKWVLVIKHPGTSDEQFKARLVILGHMDPMKGVVVNEAPTLRTASMRLLISIASAFGWQIASRDVTGAFLQSNDIRRDIYVQLSAATLRLLKHDGDRALLHLKRPQYGLADSPTYWWLRFREHHLEDMQCSQVPMDPCFFFHCDPDKALTGLIGVHVDDTILTGTASFFSKEDAKSSVFKTKSRQLAPMIFAGCTLHVEKNGFSLHQIPYIAAIQPLPESAVFSEFQCARGKLQWIIQTRLDLAGAVGKLSQVTSQTFSVSAVTLFNKTLKLAKQHTSGLRFPRVDIEGASLVTYCDASFATNWDLTSQLGFVIFLRDESGHACLLDGASKKCDRITRSVLAAELYALTHGFDRAKILQDTIERCLGHKLPIVLITDNMGIFDAITRLSQFKEKRLLIDAHAIRNSYENGELSNILYVRTDKNLADSLTKSDNCETSRTLLRNALATGMLSSLFATKQIVHPAPACSATPSSLLDRHEQTEKEASVADNHGPCETLTFSDI